MADPDAGPDGSTQDTGIMEAGGDAGKDSPSMDGGGMDATDDGATSDTGADASKPDASKDAAPPPPDGGSCNNLVNGASQVTFMQSNQQAPSATGGSVATGLYYLTAITLYNGKTGSTGFVFQLTIDVAQGTLQSVFDMPMNPTSHASFNWSTQNTTFTLTATCVGTSSTPSYTATNQTLKLYVDDGMGNVTEEVFAHQ